MTYREHIAALAAGLGVVVHFDDPYARKRGTSSLSPYTAEVRLRGPVDTVEEYIGALHELGHFATLPRPLKPPTAYSDNEILELETKAWEWAEDHAECGWDKHGACASLMSYFYDVRDGELINPGRGWEYAQKFLQRQDPDFDQLYEAFRTQQARMPRAA